MPMHTDFSLTAEFLLSIAFVIFSAGGCVSVQHFFQKKTEKRMDSVEMTQKEADKILHEVINKQGIHGEKINNISEKMTNVSSQVDKVLEILMKRTT